MRLHLRRLLPAIAFAPCTGSFTLPRTHTQFSVALQVAAANEPSLEDIKAELTKYLKKRQIVNADEEAKSEVGRIVGGTKGNKVLDYISGAPTKEKVIEDEPNIFDYDQLTKYGYGHLVTPIMNTGGRLEMYKLMEMEPPVIAKKPKPKSAPKLVIDRKGELDPARYSGLKLGQVLDDEAMARALEEANRKRQKGESLRPKLAEEDYEMPFADKRNVGPRQTPDWTAEKLDEEGIKRGKALAWVRKAKAGEFVQDPYEMLTIEGALRIYSILVAILVAFAYGRATPALFQMLNAQEFGSDLQGLIQVPALAALLAAIGSSFVGSVVLAPEKKRNQFVWAVKGLFGGPVAIAELTSLGVLQTREETEMIDG